MSKGVWENWSMAEWETRGPGEKGTRRMGDKGTNFIDGQLWILSLSILGLVIIPALAHDTGFGHSRRTIFLTATPGTLVLEYRIRQNIDEALIELVHIDRNLNGLISPDEQNDYFQSQAQRVASHLSCSTADGKKLVPKLISYRLEHSLVQIFRFQLKTDAKQIAIRDDNFIHKPGLVRIRHGTGLQVALSVEADLQHAERVSIRVIRTGN